MKNFELNKNIEESLDLEKLFYEQNIDLSKFFKSRKNIHKKIENLSLEPYKGDFGIDQKKHLLNRSLVGFSRAHYAELENLTLEESLDLIFNPEEISPPKYNFYNQFTKEVIESRSVDQVDRDVTPWLIQPGEPWVENPVNKFACHPALEFSLESWLIQNCIEQKTSIHWKLFLCILNIIPMHVGIGFGPKAGYQFLNTILSHCFASYKDLIYQITIDPCMLVYLNLHISQKDNPDENYARELQELYTVGKGKDSNFTENDVKEISKLLTGWRIKHFFPKQNNYAKGPLESIFDPENHDSSDKILSAFYMNSVVKGRKGPDGSRELNDLIDIIFETNEASKYLARRLYQFFINPLIPDEVEKNIITPLANIIKENNYNLANALKVLLGSKHFFDVNNYGSMIKDPLTFQAQIFKEIFLKAIDDYPVTPHSEKSLLLSDPVTREFYIYNMIRANNSKMGYDILHSPSVSGFVPYYQAPAYDMFWINSLTLQTKTHIAEQFGRGYFHTYLMGAPRSDKDGMNIKLPFVILEYNNPQNLDQLIEEISFRLLGSEIPNEAKSRIKESVLVGKNESYWTEYYNEFKNNPNNWRPFSQKLSEIFVQIIQLGEAYIY